jgi:hypothetical protein
VVKYPLNNHIWLIFIPIKDSVTHHGFLIAVIWTKEDKVLIILTPYKLNLMKPLPLTLILLSIHHTASSDIIAQNKYLFGNSKRLFLHAQQTI